MKKKLFNKIEIPEGIDVEVDGAEIKVKGPEGELSRKFLTGKLKIEKKDNKIIIGHEKATKREKKTMNTITAHIKNMIKGVKEKFEYKLKICFSHFPFTVNVQGEKATIKNFLGEKIPRELAIPKNANINIKGQEITITSIDKESAGQAAANFERATKIKNRDRRIFQDGIFMINKAGKDI